VLQECLGTGIDAFGIPTAQPALLAFPGSCLRGSRLLRQLGAPQHRTTTLPYCACPCCPAVYLFLARTSITQRQSSLQLSIQSSIVAAGFSPHFLLLDWEGSRFGNVSQERLSTDMIDLGILTASVWESRCCHRRLCMDWLKVSLWNLLAIHLQPNHLFDLHIVMQS